MNRRKQGLDDSDRKVTLVEEPMDLEDLKNYDDSEKSEKSKPLTSVKEEDYSFDDLESYKPSNYSKTRRKLPDFDDFDEDEEGTMKSLEKYRPSAYEIRQPRESSDINDIRDYYTNLMTKQRAINRFAGARPPNRYEPEDDMDYPMQSQPR